MNKVICAAYIAFVTGMTVTAVGTLPKSPAEPFSWYLPIIMFALTALPAVLGYLAGRDDAKQG